MRKCDTGNCDNEAEFWDPMDNKICEDCMENMIANEDYEAEDFEHIGTEV